MKKSGLLVFVGIVFATGAARAQEQNYDKVTIKTTKLAEGLYMLEGAGGNIGVSIGDDGVIVVDDQFAPLTPKIQAAIAALTPKPIRFVLNTHWHSDHVGGNENLANGGAVIIAHDNVRKRMAVPQFMELFKRQVPASPAKALPVVTFTSDITLHLNGEDVHVIHVDPAHTDGDSIVVFPKAKVVHMGDCYITAGYPFADVGSGGNYNGFIAVAEKVLGIGDAALKIIPGHGALSTKNEMKSWRDMLVEIRSRVKKEADAGKPLDAIQKLKVTATWDAKWGKGFIKPENVVEFAFKAVTSAR